MSVDFRQNLLHIYSVINSIVKFGKNSKYSKKKKLDRRKNLDVFQMECSFVKILNAVKSMMDPMDLEDFVVKRVYKNLHHSNQ